MRLTTLPERNSLPVFLVAARLHSKILHCRLPINPASLRRCQHAMRTNSKSIIIAIATLLTALPFALRSHSQTVRVELPKGKWTFSAGPYSKAEHRSMPVDVVKVRTNAAQGLTVESISLLNRSDKDVRAVKLHWYLTEKSQPQILLKGDTEFLARKLFWQGA